MYETRHIICFARINITLKETNTLQHSLIVTRTR